MENDLKELRKLYLSRASTDKLFEYLMVNLTNRSNFTELVHLKKEKTIKNNYNDANQLIIRSNTIDCEIAQDYPLPKSYSLKFLKELIKRIENSRCQVTESIYNDYIELLNDKSFNEYYYVTYTVCGQEFTFKQSDKMVSEGTTGLRSWEASFQLFEQVFANSEVFKKKRILELGSGSAMAGILISSLCEIESYTFTDHHEKVIDLIKSNLEINGFNLNRNSDKRQNKFYQFEDDDGKNASKYYEDEEHDDGQVFGSFKTGSFNSFGSNFVRQGPMDLETSRLVIKKKSELDFDCKFDKFSLNDNSEDVFNFTDPDDSLNLKSESDLFKVDLDEKFKRFDEKVENLKNEKMINFEEFLKNFEEKLSLLDENVNKLNCRPMAQKSIPKNRNKDLKVDVAELDWHSSNDEIDSKLNKYKPDYVIASDIIYDSSIILDLIRVFKRCLQNSDCGLIIVCSIRNQETIKNFEQKLRRFQNEEQNIKIQRNKLSAKLSYFEYVEPSDTKFVLYNIRIDEEDD